MLAADLSGPRRRFELFGDVRGPRPQVDAKRVGYLPENPYVYQYLQVRSEFLDLCGRLVGMDPEE